MRLRGHRIVARPAKIARPILLAGYERPHRKKPIAQLLIVPRPWVPSGENFVRSRGWPRTGPLNWTGVLGVTGG
jgi:hypothetical protein